MFNGIKDSITRNFLELKLWVSNIPTEQPETDNTIITKGLFFVYAYGLYEEIVRSVVRETISELNKANVNIENCVFDLYSMILSHEYDALFEVGNTKKWEKRWDISRRLKDNPVMNIDVTLMPTDGRNIRYKQLESIAKTFGLQESVLPRSEVGGYLKELVDNRNDIAHGNHLPREIGRKYTKEDLLKRCEYISEICEYVCGIYETYIQEKKYLR